VPAAAKNEIPLMMKTIINLIKKRYVFLILFLAAVLRLAYVTNLEDRWYYFDTAHYDSAACSILENGTFGASLHYYDEYENYCLEPVYPLFLAAIYKVFGHSFLAVRIAQSLLSILQLLVIYLTVRLFRPRAAKWALLFGAVYPFFIYISGLLYVTQIFALFLALTVFFFLKYREHYSIAWLVLSALSLGVSIASRPVALPMSLLLAAWILFLADLSFVKKLGHVLIAVISVIVVLTPWTIRNWNVYDMLSPGRTCLAETRVFETLDLEYRIEDSASMTFFPVSQFIVQVKGTPAAPIFECYADDKQIAKLKLNEEFALRDSFYVGLLFKGGDSMSIETIQFASDGNILIDSSTIFAAVSAEIKSDSTSIALSKTEGGWQYAAIFNEVISADRFSMNYSDHIKPADVSRVAILFNLNKPTLDADGYMIWLHPWMQADLWRIENGRPAEPVETIDLFIKENPIDLKALIMSDPLRFLTKHVVPEFLNFWSPGIKRVTTSSNVGGAMNAMSLLFFTPLLIFFLIGTFVLMKQWRALLVLFIPIVTISGVYSIFFTELRYRIPIDGFLIVIAAIGVHWALSLHLKARNRA
jgi:hypothetical protein